MARAKGRPTPPRIRGEASLSISVNLPHEGYELHARRVVKVLEQAGYEAYAMTGQYVIQLAAQITAELEERQEAERLLAHAQITNPETKD
jgi:hypothetical protein